jgi:hypothetical protein
MKKINDDDGTIRGLCLGTVLALLMILGLNALGRWDRMHDSGTALQSLLRNPGQ